MCMDSVVVEGMDWCSLLRQNTVED